MASPIPTLSFDMELVALRSEFQRTLRRLLSEPTRAAIAPLRGRQLADRGELLVGPWRLVDRPPLGNERLRFDDWAVLMIAPREGASPAELLTSYQLLPGQRVALLLVDSRPDQPVRAQLWRNGCIDPLARVQLVGTSPVELQPHAETARLLENRTRDQSDGSTGLPQASDPIAARESRTRGALGDLYDDLATAHVLVAGAGRGGSLLAQALVSAGLRRLTLVDRDEVAPENLDAMPCARPDDIGSKKVHVLARSLVGQQPDLMVTCLADMLHSPRGRQLLERQRFDLLATFVDSPMPRVLAAQVAREVLVPHLDVGTLIWREDAATARLTADVRLFDPGQGCAACCPPLAELDEVLYLLRGPVGALSRRPRLRWNELRSGSLFHWNALACGVAVETWLRSLSGEVPGSVWRRVLWGAGGATPEFHESPLTGDPGCRICATL